MPQRHCWCPISWIRASVLKPCALALSVETPPAVGMLCKSQKNASSASTQFRKLIEVRKVPLGGAPNANPLCEILQLAVPTFGVASQLHRDSIVSRLFALCSHLLISDVFQISKRSPQLAAVLPNLYTHESLHWVTPPLRGHGHRRLPWQVRLRERSKKHPIASHKVLTATDSRGAS